MGSTARDGSQGLGGAIASSLRQAAIKADAAGFPLVLTLTGLAVSESYGLIPAGSLATLARSPAIAAQIVAQGRQTPMIPTRWLDDWEGVVLDSELRAIARHWAEQLEGQSSHVEFHSTLNADLLGRVHEHLMAAVPSPRSCSPSRSPSALSFPSTRSPAPVRAVHSRKGRGAYYTPAEIVDYMVAETVGRWIDKRQPEQRLGFPNEPLAREPFGHELLDLDSESVEQSTGDRPLPSNDLALSPLPRILDLACGGGVFLVRAYRLLLKRRRDLLGRQLAQSERQQILQTCIFGVDLDPPAVDITRLSLLLESLRDEGWQGNRALPTHRSNVGFAKYPSALPSESQHHNDGLQHNIQQGNAILSTELGGIDWETAFPTALTDGGFDVVIGNPPYLDSEAMTLWFPQWRRYCAQHYRTATGNWDVFCVFIEKALELCHPSGFHSFVVPNKLVSAHYAAAARSHLLQHSDLLALRDYSDVAAFAASVYPLVYVVERRSPISPEQIRLSDQTRGIRYERMETLNRVKQASTLPSSHFTSTQTGWLLSPNLRHTTLVCRLCNRFPRLGDLAQVTGAATVTEAYALNPLIGDRPRLQDTDLPLVNSGTIDPYRFLWGEKNLRYLGETYRYPAVSRVQFQAQFPRRCQQAMQPKIIVAGMTRRLECAVDRNGGIVAGKSTSIIQTDDIPLLYLLGLLNSSLVSAIFKQQFGGNRLQGGYLRVGPPQLRSLPIPLPEGEMGDRLVHLVETLLSPLVHDSPPDSPPHSLHSPVLTHILQTIDALVGRLYGLDEETCTRYEAVEGGSG